jgi:DtxR family transcriptional regulator, Mn-dependent transcriptional regulator
VTTTQPVAACCALTPRAEDVLRGALTGEEEVPVTAAVSGALDPLAAHGLVGWLDDHRFTLTRHGRDHARHLARRYVLVELFLVRVLDLAPADAPAEADRLEHAVSERLLTRIDALLGRPDRDLRGEHIPRQEGWP